MVAIVGGNALGLNLGSMAALGGRGLFGQAALGQSGERSYVNVATGNLVLQALDLSLLGRGPDAAALRTYNSQGLFDFDNDDRWIGSAIRSVVSTGDGKLVRTDADGSQCTYALDAGGLYVAEVSPGSAVDTIAVDQGGYTWTDGATGIRERYEGPRGYIQSEADTSGNRLEFTYQDDLLSTVRTSYGVAGSADDEVVRYAYDAAKNLQSIQTETAAGAVLQRVEYGYDAGRLHTVTVHLDPGDPARTYVTTYGYESATSKLVTSVTQSDGTALHIQYLNGRVSQVTEGLGGGITLFDYQAGKTVVTDANGSTAEYRYDAAGNLTGAFFGVTPANANGLSRVTFDGYDARGSVRSITDGQGSQVLRDYDPGNGNLLTETDGLGTRIVRTYTAGNQLATETLLPTSGPTRTTRYVYDSRSLLRFVLSVEGRVAEYRYNGWGERDVALTYTGASYDLGGLVEGQVPTEEQLASWAGEHRAQVQRSDMAYDERGQLRSVTTYGAVDGEGAGVASTASTAFYVYAPNGRLAKTISAGDSPATTTVTAFVYDGLGREILRTSRTPDGSALEPAAPAADRVLSQQVVTLYDDAHGQVRVELANGLRTTSTYDAAGRLTSLVQDAEALGVLGSTRYAYDAAGRLLMTDDPTGRRSFLVYDEAGRKVGEVDAAGALTEYVYDAADRVTEVIRYADPVNQALLLDAGGSPTGVGLSALRSGLGPDRTQSWNLYDAGGRLSWQIDALGYATHTEYDAAGRVLSVTRLADPIDVGLLGNGAGVALALGAYGTSVALVETATGAEPNAPRLLTATVTSHRGASAPAPTGLVTFFAGEVCLGAATLVNGTAALSATNLPAGQVSLRVVYAGDAGNLSSASQVVPAAVVAAAATQTSLEVMGEQTTAGTLTLRATVTGAASPGGTVVFYRGEVPIGTAELAGGEAVLQIGGLPAGTSELSAAYQGGPSSAASRSASVSREIARANPSVELLVETLPFHQAAPGNLVTLTALVKGATPGGVVRFFDGARSLGEVALTNGLASLGVRDLVPGQSQLRAEYSGDAQNVGASSPLTPLTVLTAAGFTLEVTPPAPAIGVPVVLTATVQGNAPTGTVTFYNGGGYGPILGSAELVNGVARLVLDGLAAGTYYPTAAYSGDANNASGLVGSTPDRFQVGQAPTTTVLATERVNGSSVKLTATVTGTGNPAGPVTFYEGANPLGTVMLANGRATLTVALAAGTHGSLRADFAGGQANAASSSALATEYLTLPATTTALTSSAATIVQGQALTLTARVTRAGATPTGTVTFLQGTTVLGTATLSAGQAALSVTTLPAGAVPVTVAYAGDAANAGSIGTLTQTVTAAASTVTLQAASTTAVQGTAMLLTARVTSAASSKPSGTVTFLDGTTVLGTGTLTNGVATYSAANLTPGARQLTARYEGDAYSAVATSAAVAETVLPRPATVTVTSSVPSGGVAAGTAFTLTATVTGASPGGTVTFLDGQTVIGTAAVGAGGQAQLTTARIYTSGNPRTVTATYSGDAANRTASGTVSVRVNGTATAPAGPPVTTTALAVTPTTAVTRGMPVTLTATVTGGTSGRTITGTVSFFNGTTLVGSAMVSGGQASLVLTDLAVATASFKAVYSGDTYARTSTNATAVTKAVGKASTVTTLLTPAAQLRTGSPVTLVAQVAGAAPGGTVTFRNGTTSLGTGTVGANGLASLTLSSMAAGSYTALNAVYAGDANNNGNTSANVSMTVLAALGTSSTALAVTPALPQAAGTPVTLTATVTGTSPSGTVSFYSGSTLLGSAVISGTQARLTVDDLAGGPVQLRAVYSGSATLRASEGVLDGTVAAATTATVLSTASGPGSLTLTATVAGTGNPAGEVIFRNGATEIGRATLATGQAVLTLTGLAAAVYDLRADYQGNAANAPSSSAVTRDAVSTGTATSLEVTSGDWVSQGVPITVRVHGDNPTGVVTLLAVRTPIATARIVDGVATFSGVDFTQAVSLGAFELAYAGDALHAGSSLVFYPNYWNLGTSTTLELPGATVGAGEPVVLTARVQGCPTGEWVTFYDAGQPIGGLEAASARIVNGVAAITVTGLAAGTHSIQAAAWGAWSDPQQITVAAPPAHVTLTASSSQVARGGSLTLTASVQGNAPEGEVLFVSGSTVLGRATLASSVATLTVDNLDLPEGSAPIVAVYGGDARNPGVASSALAETVTAGTVALGTAQAPIAARRSAADRVTTFIHSADGLLLGTIDAEGYLTEQRYDAAGRAVESIAWATRISGFVDAGSIAGRVQAARSTGSLDGLRPDADATKDLHTFHYYDARGLQVAEVDAQGFLTEYGYDASGRSTATARYASEARGPVSATSMVADLRPLDTVAQTTSTTYDGLGRVQERKNAEGTKTRYAYDSVGNLVSTTVALDTSDERTVRVRYDAQGRVAAELSAREAATLAQLPAGQVEAYWASHGTHHFYDTAGRRTLSMDALGQRTAYFYDDAGRLTFTVNGAGEVTEQRYDGLGRISGTTRHGSRIAAELLPSMVGGFLSTEANAHARAAFEGLGAVEAAAGTQDSTTAFAYDARGLLQLTTDAVGGTTEVQRNAFGEVERTEQSIDHLAGRKLVSTAEYDRRGLEKRAVADLGDASHVNALTRKEYDAFGRLQSAWDANGNLWQTQYDRFGREVVSIDPLNARRRTVYDAFGRVIEKYDATDPQGLHPNRYSYDEETRKVTVTTPEGIRVTTVHNRHGQTLEVTDGNGNTTRYVYDENGNRTDVMSPSPDGLDSFAGEHTDYDALDRIVDTWDGNGNRVHYTYDPPRGEVTRTVDFKAGGLNLATTYRYDAKGQQVEVVDPRGTVTRFAYDRNGRVLTETVDPITGENPQGLNLVTVYTYDDAGHVLTVESPGHTVTQHRYDDLGRRIETVVDPTGLALKQTFTYDDAGNMVSSTDPKHLQYWGWWDGQLLTYLTGPESRSRIVYDAAGRLIFKVDAAGGVTQTSYDAEGRVAATIVYYWPISLDGLGVTATETEVVARLNPRRALEERRVYDGDGRLTFTVNGAGDVTELRYDANGNVIERIAYAERLDLARWVPGSEPVIDADLEHPTPDLMSDPDHDRRLRTVYDALNRAVFTLDGAGALVEQRYDRNGNVEERIAYAQALDAAALGRVNASWAAFAGEGAAGSWQTHEALRRALGDEAVVVADAGRDARIRREFDGANRLIWSADGTGAVTRQEYDADGNLVREVAYAATVSGTQKPHEVAPSAAGADRVRLSAYDRANRLTHQVDALGGVTERVYDGNGNVVQSIAYATRLAEPSAADVPPASITPIKDTPAPAEQRTSRDRVTRAVYDKANRAVYEIDAEGAVTGSLYDGAGNVRATTAYATRLTNLEALPAIMTAEQVKSLVRMDAYSDRTTAYAYDQVDRVTSEFSAELRHGTVYNGAGQVTNVGASSWPTGSTPIERPTVPVKFEWRTYDAAGNLTEIRNSAIAVDEYFTYDGAGNKLSFSNRGGNTWTYDYDAAGRLAKEVSPAVEVTTFVADPFTGATAPVTVPAPVTTSIGYDALGNVTSRTEGSGARTTRYEYDAAGRQVLTIHPRVAVYDAEAVDFFGTGLTESIKDLTTRVEYDAFGDAVKNVDVANNASYKVYDKLGRVRYEVDALGYVTEYERSAFGDVVKLTRYAERANLTLGSTQQPPPAATVEAALRPGTADRAIETDFDRMGRAVEVRQSQVWTFDGVEQSGGALGTLDQRTPTVRNEYDAFGQCVQTRAQVDDAPYSWATTTRFFDQAGRETVTIDAMGYATEVVHDGFGNVMRRRECAARIALWPEHNDAGPYGLDSYWRGGPAWPLPTSDDDRVTTFTYDALDRKTSETRVGVAYTRSDGTTGSDPTTTFSYDAVGNLTCTQDPTGAKTYTFYDALGRIQAVAAPTRRTALALDSPKLTPLTVFRRDALGNVVEQIEYANGAATGGEGAPLAYAASVDDDRDRHTLSVYDVLGRVKQTEDAEHYQHFTSYDAAGHVAKEWQGVKTQDLTFDSATPQVRTRYTLFRYDELGRQTSVITPGTDSGLVPNSNHAPGQPAHLIGRFLTTEEVPVEVHVEYNAFGEVIAKSTGTLGTPVPEEEQEFFDYDNAGRLWRTNSGDGVVKVMLYDLAGRQTATITSAGQGRLPPPDVVLVPALTVSQDVDLKSITDEGVGALSQWALSGRLGPWAPLRSAQTRYDLLGRATKETLSLREDSGGAFRPVVFRAFDRWGNVVKQSNPWSQRQGEVLDVEWALTPVPVPGLAEPETPVPVTWFEYNANNQVTRQKQPLVSQIVGVEGIGAISRLPAKPVTEYSYDQLGRQVAIRDPNGNVNRQEYDEAGQLIAEHHADGGLVERRYDAFGDLVRLTDAEHQHATLYSYDRLGRNTSITSDVVGVGTVALDPQDQTKLVAPPAVSGRLRTVFDYDEMGNRIRETKTAIAAVSEADVERGQAEIVSGEVTRYAYDLRGNLVATRGPGQRVVPAQFAYDVHDRKVAEQDANWNVSRWVYDAFGRLRARVDLGGKVYAYQFDNAGQLVWQGSAVEDAAAPPLPGGLLGAILREILPQLSARPSQDIAYGYDDAGQMVQIHDATIHQDTTYEYNASGRRVLERTVQDDVVYQNQVLAYDPLGRLVHVTAHEPVPINPQWNAQVQPSVDDNGGLPAAPHTDTELAIDYDLAGNKLRQSTSYVNWKPDSVWVAGSGGGEGTNGDWLNFSRPELHAEQHWYAYDRMNRQVLADGALFSDLDSEGNPDADTYRSISPLLDAAGNPLRDSNNSPIPARGHVLKYDKNGSRLSDTSWGSVRLVRNAYWAERVVDEGPPRRETWEPVGDEGLPVGTRDGQTYTDEYGTVYKYFIKPPQYESVDTLGTESYVYDAAGRLAEARASYLYEGSAYDLPVDGRTYDASSRLVVSGREQTDEAARGLVAKLTEAGKGGNAGGRRISAYDASGRLTVQQVDKLEGGLDYRVENGFFSSDELDESVQDWVEGNPFSGGLLDGSGNPIHWRVARDANGVVVQAFNSDGSPRPWTGAPVAPLTVHVSGFLGGEGRTEIVYAFIDPATSTPQSPAYLHRMKWYRGYDPAGNLENYRIVPADGNTPTQTYGITYERHEAYRQKTIVGRRSGASSGSTTAYYDVNGSLTRLDDSSEDANDRDFISDASGNVLLKKQQGHEQRQLVVNGQVLAVYGEGAPGFAAKGDFDPTYQAITGSTGAAPAQVQVDSGSTLAGLAQAVYGDASLWYLIADANGLRGDQDLRVGTTLTVPTRAGGLHNNAETFRPYDPSRIVGETTPHLPAPKAKGQCGGLGLIVATILVAVVAVVVSVATKGLLAPYMANWAAAAIGGAVGSVASQALGEALGVAKFDWKSVGISALSAGIGEGLNEAFKPVSEGLKGPQAWAVAGAKAMVANATTQVAAVTLHLQDSFDWRQVAASGAGAVTGAMANEIGAKMANGPISKILTGAFAGTVSGVTVAAAKGGRVVLQQIASDAFGNALADAALGDDFGDRVWAALDPEGFIESERGRPKPRPFVAEPVGPGYNGTGDLPDLHEFAGHPPLGEAAGKAGKRTTGGEMWLYRARFLVTPDSRIDGGAAPTSGRPPPGPEAQPRREPDAFRDVPIPEPLPFIPQIEPWRGADGFGDVPIPEPRPFVPEIQPWTDGGRRPQAERIGFVSVDPADRFARDLFRRALPERASPYVDAILRVARDQNIDPFLIAAIAEKESKFGTASTCAPRGPACVGDNEHGHGLFQVDDRYHAAHTEGDDWRDPERNARYAMSRVLVPSWNQMLSAEASRMALDGVFGPPGPEGPPYDTSTRMRNALAGYNASATAGASLVFIGMNPDVLTYDYRHGRLGYAESTMRIYWGFRRAWAAASVRNFFEQ